MASIRALVSDLDGTLLDKDLSVPRQYEGLYRFLREKKIHFFVASARPLGCIIKLFEGYSIPSGIVACDGAIITSLKDGIIAEYLESSLSPQYAQASVTAFRSAGLDPVLFLTREHDYEVLVGRNDPALLEALNHSDPTRPLVVVNGGDLERFAVQLPVRAVSAFSRQHEIATAYRKVRAAIPAAEGIKIYRYNETRFGSGMFAWLDAVSHVTRKEEAIKVLLRFHGVEEGKYLACGNGENDTMMLAAASIAFCPINSVRSVKQVCQTTTAPCEEGGVFLQWLQERVTRVLLEE
jgi:hydroxymethylpyrimidine pyrophosphatase-like HAD family hydrolase